MISRTITYKDYAGNQRTDTFYFNLTQAELSEIQNTTPGGFSNAMMKAVRDNDIPTIYRFFKDLIDKSYGEKTDDTGRFGVRFSKKDANGNKLVNQFMETEAYSALFTELTSDEQKMISFIKGVIPPDMAKKIDANQSGNNVTPLPTTQE